MYLAIATALIISMLGSNVGTVIGAEGTESVKYYEKLSYLIFLIMTLMANAIALFSFKARMLQMKRTSSDVAVRCWSRTKDIRTEK